MARRRIKFTPEEEATFAKIDKMNNDFLENLPTLTRQLASWVSISKPEVTIGAVIRMLLAVGQQIHDVSESLAEDAITRGVEIDYIADVFARLMRGRDLMAAMAALIEAAAEHGCDEHRGTVGMLTVDERKINKLKEEFRLKLIRARARSQQHR